MVRCANVAATIMEHLVDHNAHGYTQGQGRTGSGGTEPLEIDGITYVVALGDRDCSAAVIDAWRNAIWWTDYRGALDDATYTGNERSVFVKSGLFEWHPMGDGYIARRGDVYLNEGKHTAMCISAVPDMLAEFNINEKGTITGGQAGDQTGREGLRRAYYDFPWDGILAYNGKADTEDDTEEDDMFDDEARGMLRTIYAMLTNTADPTGRGKEMDPLGRLAWMAQKQEQELEGIDEIKADVSDIKAALADDEAVGGTD